MCSSLPTCQRKPVNKSQWSCRRDLDLQYPNENSVVQWPLDYNTSNLVPHDDLQLSPLGCLTLKSMQWSCTSLIKIGRFKLSCLKVDLPQLHLCLSSHQLAYCTFPKLIPQNIFHSLIIPDTIAALLVERTMAKKSFGNLTLFYCRTWATFCHCFGTNMAVLSCECNQRIVSRSKDFPVINW